MAGMPEIVIYGASGHANAYRRMLADQRMAQVVAFIDDFRGDRGHRIADRPVISLQAWRTELPNHPCLIAVGDPMARRRIAERVTAAGGRFHYPHDSSLPGLSDVAIGIGTLIGQPVYVGPNTRMGAHAVVMPMSTIGHDVDIGDFCTICPGANIGGQVILESGVFVGGGAVIVNGSADRPLVIGTGATVGAGAVVTKSVRAGVAVMGNPARPLRELAASRKRE
jgi:sugar O-acyltransferase (sialic acid O-acetyltransferase NeuD family)